MLFRAAKQDELPQIVALLADDALGKGREAPDGDLSAYLAAWKSIEADPANWILVAVQGEEVLGVLQLTLIPGLARSGAKRAQIEGVRVKSSARGQSVGQQLMQFAIGMAKEHNCSLVQLTTDKSRPDAKRFYECLGFTASHEGMKLIW